MFHFNAYKVLITPLYSNFFSSNVKVDNQFSQTFFNYYKRYTYRNSITFTVYIFYSTDHSIFTWLNFFNFIF